MNEDEIEAEIRRDTVWRRPTWPLGAGVRWMRDRDFRKARFRDGFSFFEQRSEEHTYELQSLMRISYAVFCLKIKINADSRTARYRASRACEATHRMHMKERSETPTTLCHRRNTGRTTAP